MKVVDVEFVDVYCPRCEMIHTGLKKDCMELTRDPGHYICRVWCTGNTCDGMNGEIWKFFHGHDRYVYGSVIPETYKHPNIHQKIVSLRTGELI